MKPKLPILTLILAVFGFSFAFADFFVYVPSAEAANTARATCKDPQKTQTGPEPLEGDPLEACVIGYNGGYGPPKLPRDEACGTATDPVDGVDDYGIGSRNLLACWSGWSLGAKQRKADGGSSDRTEDEAKSRAERICGKLREDDRTEACLRGYRAAVRGANNAAIRELCEKESSAFLEDDCLYGAEKANADKSEIDTGEPSDGNNGNGNQAGRSEEEADCDTKWNSPLSWIACPIIDMGVNMSDEIFENFVKPMLANIPVSSEPEDSSYKAWQQFRIIANVLLIGALLMIVYSQARGGGGK